MLELETYSPPSVPSLFQKKGKLRLLSDDSARVSRVLSELWLLPQDRSTEHSQPGTLLEGGQHCELRGGLSPCMRVCWCLGRTHL